MQFFKKYKLQLDIITVLVLVLVTFMFFDEYRTEQKKMQLVTAITGGLWTLIKIVELIEQVRKRKRKNL